MILSHISQPLRLIFRLHGHPAVDLRGDFEGSDMQTVEREACQGHLELAISVERVPAKVEVSLCKQVYGFQAQRCESETDAFCEL